MGSELNPHISEWKTHLLLAPTSSGAATRTSAAVNRQTSKAGALVVIFSAGAIDAGGTVTCTLTEADTLGGSYTTVANSDLSATPTVFTDADDNKYQAVSYRGSKNFVKAVMTIAVGAAVFTTCHAIESRGELPAGTAGLVVLTA